MTGNHCVICNKDTKSEKEVICEQHKQVVQIRKASYEKERRARLNKLLLD